MSINSSYATNGRGEATTNTPKRIKCEMSGGSLLSTHVHKP
ncbi:hypothetical protein RchiOBHm_Chr5g0033691 [Rosa chinensis]|uniref:Uncharacterized protein n=1 Tax=Rosa chinensis TaxID=74649 RepID=A0A2P6QAR7_ROSCH|nr:hypothetical protein RchiOBHm_Chr5g0033691 [Rosa chinensis]